MLSMLLALPSFMLGGMVPERIHDSALPKTLANLIALLNKECLWLHCFETFGTLAYS